MGEAQSTTECMVMSKEFLEAQIYLKLQKPLCTGEYKSKRPHVSSIQLEARVQKMKTTLCLILSALTIVSQARPQYGGAGNNNGRQPTFGQQTQVRPTARPSFLPQGCRIEYKVVYSVEEREEYENKCETKYR